MSDQPFKATIKEFYEMKVPVLKYYSPFTMCTQRGVFTEVYFK
jgi:hypothetical protein